MSTIEEILNTYIKCFHFTNIVKIETIEDIFSFCKSYDNKSIHFLCINIFINGNDLKKIMNLWDNKVIQGGAIAFKGGMEEDTKEELAVNQLIKTNYIYGTYYQQNLTILYRKFDNI